MPTPFPPAGTSPAAKSTKPLKKPLFLKVTTQEQINFSRYLAVMLDAGIPLHEALEVLADQMSDASMQYVLNTAIADLADGLPLYTSISKFPKIFSTFYINALSVGESSGTLSATLRYLAIQMEKAEDIRGKVRSALLYPSIVFIGALAIGAYLAFVMLPKMLPLFTQLKVKLPPTTQLLLNVSTWMTANWHWVIGGVVFFVIAMSLLTKIKAVRFALHSLLLRIPVAGQLVQDLQTAKFARVLGTLLSSGVTIVKALSVTAESTNNPVYKKELEKIAFAVESGETIGNELHLHRRLFSRTTASMVGVGERTGKLSDSLLTLAEFAEREVDVMTRNLSTLIEPITLILVGLLTGFIALSIITPIYQITQGIHA